MQFAQVTLPKYGAGQRWWRVGPPRIKDQQRIANPDPLGQHQAAGGTLTLWKMPHSRNLVVVLWITTFLDIPALIHFSEIIS